MQQDGLAVDRKDTHGKCESKYESSWTGKIDVKVENRACSYRIFRHCVWKFCWKRGWLWIKEDAEVDYKSKYEDLKRKLEEQARRIQTLEAEKADLAKDKATLSEKLSNMQLNGKSKNDRRHFIRLGSYDSETERLENLKLKQENAALIRIIAKVSK